MIDPLQVDHNITIGTLTGVPEWAKRLKSNEPQQQIHRSTDCIAKELSKQGDLCESTLKNAPSWTALGARPATQTQEPSHSQQHHPHHHHLLSLLHHQHTNQDTTTPKPKSSDSPGSSSTGGSVAVAGPSQGHHKESIDGGKASLSGTDEEAKAAELAAKKSRLKQSLVKRARSVAIFSLKLKERRQREAEKAAQAAIEHAKVQFVHEVIYMLQKSKTWTFQIVRHK